MRGWACKFDHGGQICAAERANLTILRHVLCSGRLRVKHGKLFRLALYPMENGFRFDVCSRCWATPVANPTPETQFTIDASSSHCVYSRHPVSTRRAIPSQVTMPMMCHHVTTSHRVMTCYHHTTRHRITPSHYLMTYQHITRYHFF